MLYIRLLIVLYAGLGIVEYSKGQTDPLFDQQNIASVKVLISTDTIAWLYNNVTSDRYFTATMVYENGSISDTVRQVGFRLRGNTSRYSRKKSFNISFNTFQQGRRYRGVKKLNLNGQHNDPTMVRQKLFYDIWNKLGLPQRRTSFVKVFLNENYYGLYTSLEEMDNDWLTRVYGVNIGNLYKCVYPADLVYLGNNQQTYKNLNNGTASGGRVYELEPNAVEDNYAGLVKLIRNIHEATGNQAEQKLREVLNVEMYLKAMALDVATGHWDNYGYNKNNFYLHHNPFTDKFDFISYDTDNTFGVDWVNIDWAQRSVVNWNHPTDPRPLANRVLNVPDFRFRYYTYLDSISCNVLHPFHINAKIDSMQTFVRPAAIDDPFRSLDYGYDMAAFELGFSGTVGGHVPYGIKPFLARRATSTIGELIVPLLSNHRIDSKPTPYAVFLESRIEIRHIEEGETMDFSLIDLNGKIIFKTHKSSLSFELKPLKPGLYYYQIQVDKQRIAGKITWPASH